MSLPIHPKHLLFLSIIVVLLAVVLNPPTQIRSVLAQEVTPVIHGPTYTSLIPITGYSIYCDNNQQAWVYLEWQVKYSGQIDRIRLEQKFEDQPSDRFTVPGESIYIVTYLDSSARSYTFGPYNSTQQGKAGTWFIEIEPEPATGDEDDSILLSTPICTSPSPAITPATNLAWSCELYPHDPRQYMLSMSWDLATGGIIEEQRWESTSNLGSMNIGAGTYNLVLLVPPDTLYEWWINTKINGNWYPSERVSSICKGVDLIANSISLSKGTLLPNEVTTATVNYTVEAGDPSAFYSFAIAVYPQAPIQPSCETNAQNAQLKYSEGTAIVVTRSPGTYTDTLQFVATPTISGSYTAAAFVDFYGGYPDYCQILETNEANNLVITPYNVITYTPKEPPCFIPAELGVGTGGYGDVNNDGVVSDADAVMILQYGSGHITLTDAQIEAADVDGEPNVLSTGGLGITVSAADSMTITQYLENQISTFPACPTPTPTPTPTLEPTLTPTPTPSVACAPYTLNIEKTDDAVYFNWTPPHCTNIMLFVWRGGASGDFCQGYKNSDQNVFAQYRGVGEPPQAVWTGDEWKNAFPGDKFCAQLFVWTAPGSKPAT